MSDTFWHCKHIKIKSAEKKIKNLKIIKKKNEFNIKCHTNV